MTGIVTRRCAIYTRKSSEEGLEQGFNSLHAQREACEAYVLSQAGEGWTPIATIYDDGGFSGGTMERPGLKALLADIGRGLIDIVVVYKVDRLTRALTDFAKIVDLFDGHEVSFVSVTQAFNTTTSMGRLTLNVLLSFAQFEREVTGERIRDKIAQSKAKGLWMGGRPPLGYDGGAEQRLVVNAPEADVVRRIFDRYLALGSVTALTLALKAEGVHSKRWTNRRAEPVGGAVLSRGAIYHMLANPVYRGAIKHKAKIHLGAHPAIIDTATWDRVQALLEANGNDVPEADRLALPVLLQGLLFDDLGNRMGPLHTRKGAKRYRYYASSALKCASGKTGGSLPRIAMGVLDAFVTARVGPLLADEHQRGLPMEQRLRAALRRVVVGVDRVVVTLAIEALTTQALEEYDHHPDRQGEAIITFRISLKHRQGAVLIEALGDAGSTPRVDRALVRAVCLARRWAGQLASGEGASTKDLARENHLCDHYAARLLPLAWLAPDLAAAIMEGRQPLALSLGALVKRPLPMDWEEQRRLFEAIG